MDKFCFMDWILFESFSEDKKNSFSKDLMPNLEMFPTEPIQSLEEFEKESINLINHDEGYTLEDKLEVTTKLLKRVNYLPLLSEDFLEEECHLSMVNWICKELKDIKKKNEGEDFNHYVILLQLIYNIIYILQCLQIKTEDILGLKLYEKLIKIKKFISKLNVSPLVLNQINFLLTAWKTKVEKSSEESLLKKKRQREITADEETEDDSGKSSPSSVYSPSDNISLKLDIIKPKKVSFNLIKNDLIIYDKTKEPFYIQKDKNIYDPTLY